MNWRDLLNEERRSGTGADKGPDLRSEFGKDYHRIIESAPFRRLQDKTQVFPLDKSDFIRTRLTHSLEVSSLCLSLGQNISRSIIAGKLDPDFDADTMEKVCEILQSAGLIHDIGNPPFGHFGEEAIREWFKKNIGSLEYKGRKISDILTEGQLQDFIRFEGNAQGLRLITELDGRPGEHGMDLTYGLLSCVIKYPVTSTGCSKDSPDIKEHKMGVFCSEKAVFDDIRSRTGTGRNRNPLVFILEAADDIAYSTADIEDAYVKGYFDYDALLEELDRRGVSSVYTDKLRSGYSEALKQDPATAGENAILEWLREMQEVLIAGATKGFTDNYTEIMSGSYTDPLIFGTEEETLLNALKRTAYDTAFVSDSIFKTEIAANTMLTYILDVMVPSVLHIDDENGPGLMEEKYITLISGKYLKRYMERTKDMDDGEKVYYRILLATDYISGMTDSYARDLYFELHGGVLH